MSKLEKQEILQAIILASDFNVILTPMHHVCPSILTPVANISLLDYLLELLIRNGIQEVFIYCSSHIDILKNYISEKNYENISISLIISDGCRSLGDALRDIDTKGCIRGDFILVRGNAFVNINITQFMNKHKLKREKDKGSVMTMVLKNVGTTKKTLLSGESCLFLADKLTDQILFYKKSIQGEKKIKFDTELFLSHEQISINSGFIDTHVYMCSPALLPLFSDNFDFQTMEDFIRGVLINEEILNSRIYWQPLNHGEYALPITSWSTYHTLNRDVLHRLSYPLTPDMLWPPNDIVFTLQSIYKHKNVTLVKGCKIEKDTIIGCNTLLRTNTLIDRSMINSNCKIGNNVVIENSYLWDNVVIKDNCTVKNSVLFSNVILNANVHLDACIILPDINVLSENNYSTVVLEQDDGKLVVKNFNHYSEECKEILYFKRTLVNDNSCDSDIDTDDSELSSEGNLRSDSPVPDDTHMFLNEVIDSLLRGYQDKLNCENLILEINSSRYAYNVGIREVTYNVVKAILMLPNHYLSENKSTVDDLNYQNNLKTMLNYFHSILLKYIKSDDAQQDCLKAIEEVSETCSQLLAFSQRLLHLLYQKDIITEDNILKWYNKQSFNDDEIYNTELRTLLQPFIKWLNEAEEDTSSSNDDTD